MSIVITLLKKSSENSIWQDNGTNTEIATVQ